MCADLRGTLYEDKEGWHYLKGRLQRASYSIGAEGKRVPRLPFTRIELEMEDVLNRKSKGLCMALDYFTEHKNIEKLTREVVVSLIREIKVFDKTHIEVVFDFLMTATKNVLMLLQSQGHLVEVDST